MLTAQGIKNPRGPGETAGMVGQRANHENKIIIARRKKICKGALWDDPIKVEGQVGPGDGQA